LRRSGGSSQRRCVLPRPSQRVARKLRLLQGTGPGGMWLRGCGGGYRAVCRYRSRRDGSLCIPLSRPHMHAAAAAVLSRTVHAATCRQAPFCSAMAFPPPVRALINRWRRPSTRAPVAPCCLLTPPPVGIPLPSPLAIPVLPCTHPLMGLGARRAGVVNSDVLRKRRRPAGARAAKGRI
jgi:hypothetical protein